MKKQNTQHIRLKLIMIGLTLGVQTLIEILMSVNSILSTDIIYYESIFPDIFNTAVSILEIAAMSIGLSFIATALFMGKRSLQYALIFAGAVLYRRIFALGITLLLNGSLELDDILMSISVFLLDLAVLIAALIICNLFAKKYRRNLAYLPNETALFGEESNGTCVSPVYPFQKIYGKDNLLQGCLLSIGILLSAVKVITRTFGLFIAAPDSIMLTVGGYIGDIVIIALSYAISCLLLSVLYGENEKRKAMHILYNKDQPSNF